MPRTQPIITRGGRCLHRAPCGAQFYRVPEGIQDIDAGCFKDCWDTIEKIVLPDTLIHISSGAFWECARLRHVTIPESVRWIDIDAFYRCPKLRSITVLGHPIFDGRLYTNCPSLESVIQDGKNIIKQASEFEIRPDGQRSLLEYDREEAKT